MTLLQFLASKTFWKHLGLAVVITGFIILLTFLSLRVYTHHGQAISVPDFRGLEIEEARELADDYDLRLEIIDSVFYNTRPKGSVIDQSPSVNFKVKKDRRIFITTNAFAPEKVKMPNVVGVSHRQAKAMLQNRGLEIGKLIHVPDIAINNVLKQQFEGKQIEPGTSIPKGSKIDLVLGKGLSDQRIALPNLEEYTLAEARDRLLRAALNLGATIYDESIENFQDSLNAKVWRQYPTYRKNRSIRLGSSVDIWLSVDSAKFVPDTISVNTLPNDEKLEL